MDVFVYERARKSKIASAMRTLENTSIHTQTPMRGGTSNRSHLDGKYGKETCLLEREREKKRSLPKVARLTEDIPLSLTDI